MLNGKEKFGNKKNGQQKPEKWRFSDILKKKKNTQTNSESVSTVKGFKKENRKRKEKKKRGKR